MAVVYVNDFATVLAAPLPLEADAGVTFDVVLPAPASVVGSRVYLRVGSEIVIADVTGPTVWTIVEREAEDSDRYPKQAWPAGTALDIVLTEESLALLIGQGGGGSVVGQTIYRFSTSTVMADPGSGKLRLDNADPMLATYLAISRMTEVGTDVANVLASIRGGDAIYIQDQDDADCWVRYSIYEAAEDHGTWFAIGIGEATGSGTAPANNDRVVVELSRSTLPANLAYLDRDQTFTGENTFTAFTAFTGGNDVYIDSTLTVGTGLLSTGPIDATDQDIFGNLTGKVTAQAAASQTPLTVKLAALQTADPVRVQTSAGARLGGFTVTGGVIFSSSFAWINDGSGRAAAVDVDNPTVYRDVRAATFTAGADLAHLGPNDLQANAAFAIEWTAGSTHVGTKDTGLERESAGVLKVTDGSTGTGKIVADGSLLTDLPNQSVTTGPFRYSSALTMADPGSGKIRGNSLTGASVTQIAISVTDDQGVTAVPWLASVRVGDTLFLQDKVESLKWARFVLTAAPTNNTTWYQLAVACTDSSGYPPTNNNRLAITVGYTGVPANVARTDAANTFTAAPQTVVTPSASGTPLVVKTAASQTADTIQVQNSAGTAVAGIDANGQALYLTGAGQRSAVWELGGFIGFGGFPWTGSYRAVKAQAYEVSNNGFQLAGTALALMDSYQINWANWNQYTFTKDVGLARDANTFLRVTNGSTGLHGLMLNRLVSPPTSPATITADQNNYAPTPARITRVASDAARTITGLVAGLDGEVRQFINVGSNNIILAHESGSSTAANRFLTTTAASVTVAANGAVGLVYDGTTQRWRVFS